jgi:hypothetical protein
MDDKKPEQLREELFSEAFYDYYYADVHECKPYIGLQFVEPYCQHCGKYINSDRMKKFTEQL